MTLETIYFLAEIGAALGVIASLIFVGVQLRMQREDARLATIRDVHKEWRDLLRYVIENEEMSNLIWFKARSEGFAALTPEESLRVIQHSDIFVNYWQETYRHYKAGRLDAAHYHAVEKKLSGLLDAKGGQEILQALLPDLTDDFREHILGVVEKLQGQELDAYDRARDEIVVKAGIHRDRSRRSVDNQPEAGADSFDRDKGAGE